MKKLERLMREKKGETVFKWILILCIFLYPFVHSFIGIDLGDTGLHTFNFENLYDVPELIGFTSYFTTFVGWIWLKCFGSLGLWGLNLLEVIIEMLMAFTVYRTFKEYLGEHRTLVGILVAVTASDTYLNVFNYHQFNVFLLILVLCFEFKAIVEDKYKYSILAGIAFSIVIFSRMGSITAIVTCFLYFFWYWIKSKKKSFLIRHLGSFSLGTVCTAVIMILLLKTTGQLQYFIDNIFRLSGLASSSGNGYSMNNLWDSFFLGNLNAIASGAIVFAAAIVLLLGVDLLLNKEPIIKKKIVNVLIAFVVIGIAIYQLIYAYDVNPAAAWPQMTTGPSYVIGVLYVVCFFCIMYHLYSMEGKPEIALITVEAILLPLLTIAGSNTGTKQVILGLWIIGPVAVYVIFSLAVNEKFLTVLNQVTSNFGIKTGKLALRVTIGVVAVSFGAKFAHMLYYTMNFDSVDRSEINSSIDNPKVKYLKTTKREADAVNGVLQEIDNLDDKNERPLIVFGGSLLFYYMTDMDSFVQPWFSNTNYAEEKLETDMEAGYEKYDKLPVVIYGRTNNYYGFYEYDYEEQLSKETANWYSGKKERLIEFLDENDYELQYMNDYYVLLYPTDIAVNGEKDYKVYLTGDMGE